MKDYFLVLCIAMDLEERPRLRKGRKSRKRYVPKEWSSDDGCTTDEENGLATVKVPRCKLWTKLCEKDKYFDVLFVIDNEERRSHKLALACASDVFDKMFTGGLKEAQDRECPLRVPLEGVLLSTLDHLLTLIYTGKVQLPFDDLLLLTRAADMYQMHDILSALEDTISDEVDLSNFIELWDFACLLNLSTVRSCIGDFASENSVFICLSPALEKLPPLLFQEMVCNVRMDELMNICDGIKDWAEVDLERQSYVDDILKKAFAYCVWDKQEQHLANIGVSLVRLCGTSSIARELLQKVVLTLGSRPAQSYYYPFCSRCKRRKNVNGSRFRLTSATSGGANQ